ncbi:hypothetical protein [Cellulomonas sp. URHD0024]|uniref:hypothetical protein n=1 Tax=Cellulomonas sp. URHD0024 TaxID=1302620 RepID=UPI0004008D1F|nr:hypothetical protein [Cellulomonas sp. URHD0024]
MDATVVPAEVENALARLGLRATTLLDPDRWLAVAVDGTGHRVQLHAMDADVQDDALVARVARLRGVRHDHLVRLLDATELTPGRVGLLVEDVEALSLAQIRAARAPLTDGEAATVAIPVAGALGALHDAGLVHGAVDRASILVRPDGRPILGDLRGVVVGASTPAEDLAALAAVVIAQLPHADVHLLAGGLVLRDALIDTLARPSVDAAMLAEACFHAVQPEALQLPDAGSLASSALLTSARRPPTAPTRRSSGRRFPTRFLALVCVAALGLGLAGWRLLSTAGSPASALTDERDPVAAAIELSRIRAAAIGEADADRLTQVEIADGPAHAVDAALLAALDPARTKGLAVDIQDAWLVAEDGTRGSTTDVAVTAAMSTASGPDPARTVVLGLRWTDDGWRVWDVTEPAR